VRLLEAATEAGAPFVVIGYTLAARQEWAAELMETH
jgi:hypothetical protein